MLEILVDSEEKRTHVQDQYTKIAEGGSCSCCGPKTQWTDFSEDYSVLDGYVADADYGLGCGIPTEYVNIQPGETVIDLGSGAGNDVFVARSLVGEMGTVIGIDFTPAMIDRARKNAEKLGFHNVSFIQADIEDLPIGEDAADVIVSNCVLNLVPDKKKAFTEIFRVLKPGGRFCVSDIVSIGDFPEALRDAAALYAGCVSGAINVVTYTAWLREVGFTDVTIVRERPLDIPEKAIKAALGEESAANLAQSGIGLLSATITGTKPVSK